MGSNRRLFITGLLTGGGVAIHAQHAGHSRKTIDDDMAFHLFFLLLRDAPPPSWTRETKFNHLSKHGFNREEAAKIVSAANFYFEKTAALDWRIQQVNSRQLAKGNTSDLIAATGPLRDEKKAILREIVDRLAASIGGDGKKRLLAHMEHVKKNSR